MKTKLKLPVSSKYKCLVDTDENITPNTPLAEKSGNKEEKTIHLSQLLGVKNQHILKYLKKKVGDIVDMSEVIAEKKSIFSSIRVKSPVSGKIYDVNLHSGILSLGPLMDSSTDKIYSPCKGKVSNIGKEFIEIEFDGEKFEAEKGDGKEVTGDLVYLAGENIGILDFDNDVSGSIVVCKSINEESIVKIDVMGAVGLITSFRNNSESLPWVQVKEDILTKLIRLSGRKTWLRPPEKIIYVFD